EGNGYHLNFIRRYPARGGDFVCDRVLRFGRFIVFNPWKNSHYVTRVEDGERIVWRLSFFSV
ncbi:2OG-Fe(II) oxygenase, partial [bacterium]|nr:2OG-Fe(II) oxygenase [bacterium]